MPDCLSSLVADNVPDVEYILIDDGSTDGTGSICDTFCSMTPNAMVIHRNNGGLCAARNTGFEALDKPNPNRWIWFVDSDDIIAPGALVSLDKCAKEANVDAIHFEYSTFNNKDVLYWNSVQRRQRGVVSAREFLSGTYSFELDHYLWLFLFRSTTLTRLVSWRETQGLHKLCNEEYSFLEDLVFVEELMQEACRTILCLPNVFYGYRQSTTSMSHAINPRSADSALRALRYIDCFDVPDSDRRPKEFMQIALLFNAYRAAGQAESSASLRKEICGEIERRVDQVGVTQLPRKLLFRYAALKSGIGDVLLKRRKAK